MDPVWGDYASGTSAVKPGSPPQFTLSLYGPPPTDAMLPTWDGEQVVAFGHITLYGKGGFEPTIWRPGYSLDTLVIYFARDPTSNQDDVALTAEYLRRSCQAGVPHRSHESRRPQGARPLPLESNLRESILSGKWDVNNMGSSRLHPPPCTILQLGFGGRNIGSATSTFAIRLSLLLRSAAPAPI